MKFTHRSLTALCCAALVTQSLSAQTSASQGLMPYLPADTLMAFSTPNMQRAWEQYQQLPMGKIWREDQVQKFIEGPMQQFEMMLEMQMGQLRSMHEEGSFPIDPDAVMAMRPKSMTFALTSLDLGADENGAPNINVGLMLHLDAGSGGDVLHTISDMMLGQIASEDQSMVLGSTTMAETTVATLKPPAEAPTQMGLHIAKVPGGILFATLGNELEATLSAMKGGTLKLGASDTYKSSAQALGMGDQAVEIFMRADRMIDTAMGMMEFGMQMAPAGAGPQIDMAGLYRAMDVLGISSLGAMDARVSYQDGKALTRSFTQCPKDARTGLMAMGSSSIDTEFLKWVPKDAVNVGSMGLDISAAFDTLMNAIGAYDEQAGEMVTGMMAQMKESQGLDIEQDLLRAFGDRFAYWMMPNSNLMASPEAIALIQVKNPDGLLRILRAMDEMAGEAFDLRSTERRGVESHSVRLDLEALQMGNAGAMQFNPADFLSPTFSFNKGYMVVGFSAGDVRRAVKRMNADGDTQEESILDNPEFASMLTRLDGRQVSGMSWVDNRNLWKGYYQGVVGMAAFLPMGPDSPINMSLVPDYDNLGKHMFPTQSWTEVTDAGFMNYSEGPVGPEVMVTLGMLVGAGVAVATDGPGRYR